MRRQMSSPERPGEAFYFPTSVDSDSWARLRIFRRDISRDVHDIVFRQFCDDWLHKLRRGCVARALFDVEQLADNVDRMETGDCRHIAKTLQLRAVTDGAGNRLAVPAGGDKRLALLDASGWDIGNESRVRIPQLDALCIFRNFDNALSDRFHPAIGLDESHVAAADIGHGNGIRFLHFDP